MKTGFLFLSGLLGLFLVLGSAFLQVNLPPSESGSRWGADSLRDSSRAGKMPSVLGAKQDTTSAGLSPDSLPIGFGDTLQANQDASGEKLPRRLDRVVPNRAFQVGEKLFFKIKYGFIKAGYATMEVLDTQAVADTFVAYRIRSTARSTRGFDLIYKVRDSVYTYVDTRGLFSWKFIKRLREGGYKFDLFVDYDQLFGKAYVTMIRYFDEEPLRIRKKEEFVLPIPKYVLDVLASFYYVRTQPLEVGMPVYITNHDNKKVYNLQVIIQKKERIEVEAGTFDCLKVQPRLKGEAIFKQKGKLWIWLTDDEKKIPVLMKSKVAVGSITTELYRVEGVNGGIPARVE